MHLKRQKTPKNWAIQRKGTKYIVRPSFNLNHGVPILIILRDFLKLAQNRKEVKIALNLKHILVNSKPIKDDKYGVSLFDIITIIPLKKNYRLELSEIGKFKLNEIKDSESSKKVSKVINKKILKGKKTQLNLSDGMNFISDIRCSINDSVLVNLKERKIEECLPLKSNSNVFVFEGKHAGRTGKVKSINSEFKNAELEMGKEKVHVLIKQLIVIK